MIDTRSANNNYKPPNVSKEAAESSISKNEPIELLGEYGGPEIREDDEEEESK